jgi:hypothetical protein
MYRLNIVQARTILSCPIIQFLIRGFTMRNSGVKEHDYKNLTIKW